MTKILVVDDSEMDRRIICGVLEQDHEMEPVPAIHGGQALQKLEEASYDAVVTDLIMPGMGGLELVGRMRELHPHVPVIIVTSRGSEVTAVEALKRGAASYVPKQLLAKLLVQTVRELAAVSGLERIHNRLLDCIEETRTRFCLENDRLLLDSLVTHVMELLRQARFCDQGERTRMGVALKEALNNALLHGNLELTAELTTASGYAVHALVEERRNQEPLKDRRIHVDVKVSGEEAVFQVRDDGAGFDLGLLPDAADPKSIAQFSGRGVVLMRSFMDEVEYAEGGRQVTLIKRRGTR